MSSSQPTPSMLTFFDLPDDILLHIITFLESQSLYSLLLVSRSAQRLAIHAYLSQLGCTTSFSSLRRLSLLYNNGSIKALKGLRVYIHPPPWHVDKLQFRFRLGGGDGYLADIRRASQLLFHQVDDIQELVLGVVPQLTKYEAMFPSPLQAAQRARWENAFLQLLNLSSRMVRRRLVFSFWTASRAYDSMETWTELHFPTRPVAFARNTVRRTVEKAITASRRSAINMKEQGPVSLEELKISSLVPLIPKFLPWTLSLLSQPSLTIIELDCSLSTQGWSSFLPLVSVPNLQRLLIKSPDLRVSDLEKFLVRHDTLLRELEVHTKDETIADVADRHLHKSRVAKLPYLARLMGGPADVGYFLARGGEEGLPVLQHVGIEMSVFTQGYAFMEEALWELVRWANANQTGSISLCLTLQDISGLGDWLSSRTLSNADGNNNWESNGGSSRPECLLRCVRRLELRPGRFYRFSDKVVERIPDWLAIWPGLEQVVLEHDFAARVRDSDYGNGMYQCQGLEVAAEVRDKDNRRLFRFVEDTAKLCGSVLRSVSINGEVHVLEPG